MDYFLLNEIIFKELINCKKEFILKFLNSININIDNYDLFEIYENSNECKVDLLLFSKKLVINIELNKNKVSLKRNKIYHETITKLLSNYKVIQININLFKEISANNIYNFFDENEYLKFITSKDYNNFETKNSYILDVIAFLNKLDKHKYINKIKKEQKIKANLDRLFKE